MRWRGRFEDSAAGFSDLHFMQQLDGRPLARMAFAHSLFGKGSAAAAERGLQALLKSSLDAQVLITPKPSRFNRANQIPSTLLPNCTHERPEEKACRYL